MCVCRGTVITLWEMPPTRKAGQDSPAVCTQEAGRPARQAAFPEAGLGVSCSDGHD